MTDSEYSDLCEALRDTLKEFGEMIHDIRLTWREETGRDCPFTHYDVMYEISNVSRQLDLESDVIKRYLYAVRGDGERIIH